MAMRWRQTGIDDTEYGRLQAPNYAQLPNPNWASSPFFFPTTVHEFFTYYSATHGFASINVLDKRKCNLCGRLFKQWRTVDKHLTDKHQDAIPQEWHNWFLLHALLGDTDE